MKSLALLFVVAALLLSIGCGSEADSAATPDLAATEQAEEAAARPTETPTPTADINATITASMIATEVAESTPPPTPTPTPDIDATVTALTAATIAAIPTAAPTIVQTPTPTPEPTFTPVPEPTGTPTPQPTATRAPNETPRPTFTPLPPPTPVPTRAAGLSLVEMVKQVRPAVVRIQAGRGGGSGVIFETQGQTGYVITNDHVVEGYRQVNVEVNDLTTYRGTVLGSDSVRDLAVVSICCGNFRALPFGDASRLEPGEKVVVIGYPLDLPGQASTTEGIVSAIRYHPGLQSNVIQTNAAINPGNSGGPMLSMEGEILGINTFRIDESSSGRVAEGLGFAVSETTVRQRIPILKTSRAAPAPTPTRRSAPTRSYGGGNGYGPASGELWHDPSDGLIKTEFSNLFVSDVIVSATFVNPYSAASNDWDYGFIFRKTGTGSSIRFLQVVVTSRGEWGVSYRRGSRTGYQTIEEGTVKAIDTSEGGRNKLWVTAFGGKALFFVNDAFVSLLDLSRVTDFGDVAVITGAYAGGEVAGAVTRYENFQVLPLQKAHGPVSGKLQGEQNFIASYESGVRTKNLVAQATFISPRGRNWDYGFTFRNPSSRRLEVVGVEGSGDWFHKARDIGDNTYTEKSGGALRAQGITLGGSNHLVLFAFGDLGLFLVNGKLVAKLDLSHNLDFGDTGAMADFYIGHQGSPNFQNYTVWTP